MSYSAIVYKVMIASPSDVSAERSIVREVLSEWNVVSSDARCQVLLPIGWETHSVPEMGDRPQALINKQILHDCDLLVGVFWTRIGTATGEYASGTVEEIEEHIKTGRPTMLYFSSAPVLPDSVDADQYRRLKEFKLSCQSRGLYEPYGDVQDFRTKLYRQLQLKVNRDAYFQTAAEPAGSPTILELEPGPTLSKGPFCSRNASLIRRGRCYTSLTSAAMSCRSEGRTSLKTITIAHEQSGLPLLKSLRMMAC
ncbi:DUF4062 domain-containing protein [Candidatus Aalborgicola defluviihabitans]|uniref:DUF4062 domain-containing protein n=1 Tax=Candidatus Aalborgicola defluviihabitans TaxID=3386187 RepID=UPI0039B95521